MPTFKTSVLSRFPWRSVTFWQVFECDNLSQLKNKLDIVCHFGTRVMAVSCGQTQLFFFGRWCLPIWGTLFYTPSGFAGAVGSGEDFVGS